MVLELFPALLFPSPAPSILSFTLSTEDLYSSYSCCHRFSASVTPSLSSLLICFSSPLWKHNDLCSLICWTNRVCMEHDIQYVLLGPSVSPQQAVLTGNPYTGACGRCGHTLKTPRKCTCSLAHLGVWQWPISLNKAMGEVRHHIPKWLSGKESVCLSRRHRRCGFDPWARKMPWRRAYQPTPVFLPENPMDGGGWQAAICGDTKSWTWLKRLVTHA